MSAGGRPIVAIVGRPNVGKSALFNRLLARRVAIVEGTPGVTRDRLHAACEWAGREFVLVDTGGLVSGRGAALAAEIRRQTERAIAEAQVVLFVVDVTQGVTPQDAEIGQWLRESRRAVLLIANKVDSQAAALGAYEFHALGLGEPLMVSATQGLGIGDLLDEVVARLPRAGGAPPAAGPRPREGRVPPQAPGARHGGSPVPPAPADGPGEGPAARETGAAGTKEQPGTPVRVAVLGRPNVGKSSLVNALLGEERVIVDVDPGTTRDAIDTSLVYLGRPVVLIDTAGLRRRSRVDEPVEFYSTRRTYDALTRADVAVLVVDATIGITDQDQRIARAAYEAGRALVVAVNKWDLVTGYAPEQVESIARQRLRFLGGARVCLTSARRGEGIDALMRAVFGAAAARAARIPTGPLNKLITHAVRASGPAADGAGRRLHIYYATQPQTHPPTIVLFVNDPGLFAADYRRYLERRLRAAFDLEGTPIRWALRGRKGSPAARTLRPSG